MLRGAVRRPRRPSGSYVVAALGIAASLVATGCGGSTAPTAGPSVVATVAPAATGSGQTPAATSGPTVDPLALAAAFEGVYAGTWSNTTYGSTGAVGFTVTLDRTTSELTIVTTLGGNVFGQPAPAPETVTAKVDGDGAISYVSPTFGPVTVTASLVGDSLTLLVEAMDVPSARVATFRATGTVAADGSMDFDYTVTFRDGTAPAKGTATIAKT